VHQRLGYYAASAQLATAELNGRVTDSSAAVLPGATVTATQTGDRSRTHRRHRRSGSYLISNLPTGPYRLEISLQGFRSYARTGLVLTVGATPTIKRRPRARLARRDDHGRRRRAAGRRPQRRHSASVIENERILELPLNGRNPAELVLMVGAAVQTAEATNRTSPGGVARRGCTDAGRNPPATEILTPPGDVRFVASAVCTAAPTINTSSAGLRPLSGNSRIARSR